MKILLVEREADIRNLFELFLTGEGFDVKSCKEPPEAFEIIDSWNPDVIFSSLVFQTMDGFTFCRKLRADNRTKSALIVAFTGFCDSDIGQKTLDAGFDKFFLKPTSIHHIFSAIDAYKTAKSYQKLMQA